MARPFTEQPEKRQAVSPAKTAQLREVLEFMAMRELLLVYTGEESEIFQKRWLPGEATMHLTGGPLV
jgi:hypothetical protein